MFNICICNTSYCLFVILLSLPPGKNYLTTSRTITDVILGLLKRFNDEEDLGDSDDNIKDNGLVERIDTDNLDRINIRGNEPIERNDYRADGENNDSDLIKK